VDVCSLERLSADRGVAALVDGRPIAIFRRITGDLHAIDNVDPISRASILSRGIVGEIDGRPTVASPMYKQRFDLRTGVCIDDPRVTIGVHDVRTVNSVVQVRPRASS
jgi:nitrite reductase (NADH) small subunit